jgi:hypothetical protein
VVDLVTNAIADLTTRMARVSAIKNRAVYVYDQEDLLSAEASLKTPCAGVLYVGMAVKDNATRKEKAILLTAQIAFIGGEFCELPNSQVKEKTTKILDDIRREVIAPAVAATDLIWRFESEAPFEINRSINSRDGRELGAKLLGYVQVWTTPIDITKPFAI